MNKNAKVLKVTSRIDVYRLFASYSQWLLIATLIRYPAFFAWSIDKIHSNADPNELEGGKQNYRINGFTLITDSINTHPLFNMLEGSFACSLEWKYANAIVDSRYKTRNEYWIIQMIIIMLNSLQFTVQIYNGFACSLLE